MSRSAATGRYVTASRAHRNPGGTVTEARRTTGSTSRGTTTGRVVTEQPTSRDFAQRDAALELAATLTRPLTAPSAAPRTTTTAGARPRSTPADDPLAPERTRWLADAVGGVGRLATLLGVSPSQTSRWSRGEERPGVDAAPLLIDLEHVVARVRLVFAEPSAGVWMVSANSHLGGARPVDVLTASGPGPVLEALDAQTWGSAA